MKIGIAVGMMIDGEARAPVRIGAAMIETILAANQITTVVIVTGITAKIATENKGESVTATATVVTMMMGIGGAIARGRARRPTSVVAVIVADPQELSLN